MPVVTISGYQFGRLLGGVLIVESIFVAPDMGTLMIDRIVYRDFIVIHAVVLHIAAFVLELNLEIDLLYDIFDPRIRSLTRYGRRRICWRRERRWPAKS